MSARGLTRRAALLAAGGALAACGAQPASAPGGKRRLRFATDWRAQAEHGGFYQAVATGLYAAKGLDVVILQGGPGSNVPQLLAAGAVELGLGSNASIPLNIVAAGAPVRAVQASFQKDPQVLITHARADVTSIADIAGKPVLISDASVTAWWPWLRAKYGFKDQDIRKYTFNLAPFLADQNAIQQGYATSEPFSIKRAGVEPKVFMLSDAGYLGYAAMTLAPQSLIDDEPETVQAFVDATAAGWASYLNGDPAPADALIQKDNPDISLETLAEARGALKSYGIVESGDAAGGRIGIMTEDRWKRFFEEMSAAGVYPAELDWRKAFTLQFISDV